MSNSGRTFTSVKDSGDRHDFGTGSVRDRRSGKGLFHLVPTMPLRRLAVHFENGAAKYGHRNWEKGQPLSSYIDSCFRHLLDVIDGKTDEDHEAAVLWNMACFMQTREWIEQGRLPAEVEGTNGDTVVLNDMPLETEKTTALQEKLKEITPSNERDLSEYREPVSDAGGVCSPQCAPIGAPEHKAKQSVALSGKQVYISGPMTGLPNNNAEAFVAMADYLKGYPDIEVFDPTQRDRKIDTSGYTWEKFLSLDLPHVISSDCLVTLPGWETSRGALLEILTAMFLNIPVFESGWVQERMENSAGFVGWYTYWLLSKDRHIKQVLELLHESMLDQDKYK